MTSTQFNDTQVAQLLQPIHFSRVLEDGQGHSHVAQQDVLAHLVRVFGFGNFDIEVMSAECVFEQGRPNNTGAPNDRYDVCYRAMVRLTIRNEHGHPVCHYENGSTATAQNQKRGDAHDLAYKSAISLSVKRAAIALGDQFGLSLYNKGQTAALVRGTLVGAPPKDAPADSERDVQQGIPQQVALGNDEADVALEAPETHQQDTAPQPPLSEQAINAMREHWNNPEALAHVRGLVHRDNLTTAPVPARSGGTTRPLGEVLDGRIAELSQPAQADQASQQPADQQQAEPAAEPESTPAEQVKASRSKEPPRPTAGPARPDLVQYPDSAQGEHPNPGLIDRSTREPGDAEVLFEDEAIFQADTLGKPFCDYVQPMLERHTSTGRCYTRAGAIRLLVGNRPKVAAALRKDGMATAATAYADLGTTAPVDINAVMAQTERGPITVSAADWADAGITKREVQELASVGTPVERAAN